MKKGCFFRGSLFYILIEGVLFFHAKFKDGLGGKFFSRTKDRTWETRLVGRIGEMLGFQAKPRMLIKGDLAG